jgi:hypothetical protein
MLVTLRELDFSGELLVKFNAFDQFIYVRVYVYVCFFC